MRTAFQIKVFRYRAVGQLLLLNPYCLTAPHKIPEGRGCVTNKTYPPSPFWLGLVLGVLASFLGLYEG